MKKRLLILGASGHGKVVGDCAAAMDNWNEIIFFDDRWPALNVCGPWPVVGNSEALLALVSSNDHVFVAVGKAETRLNLLSHYEAIGLDIPTLIHPSASVSHHVTVGAGTLIAAGAVVNIATTLGKGCIVNTGSTVDHDCVLADGVHVCPGANLAGDVHAGRASWIGIGSSVIQCIRIGAEVTVGAGAVVISDISDGMTVIGSPARSLPMV